MKKLLTLFSALVFALSMMASNAMSNDETPVYYLDYAHTEAGFAPDANRWLLYLFNMEDNTIQCPYIYALLDAKSATAISGTYTPVYVALYDGTQYIPATQMSDLVITYVSEGMYHYQLSFQTQDANYIVDLTISMNYVYNTNTNKQIVLNEDPTKYYLVGTMNNWTASEAYMFEANPSMLGEYKLKANLAVGDEFKVIGVLGNTTTWYPDGGGGTNYVVTGTYAGNRTIYFRPEGTEGWESFHQGGYFSIYLPQDIYVNVNSGMTLIDYTASQNSVWQLLKSGVVSVCFQSSQIPGTYTASNFYGNYNWVYNETSDERIAFTNGLVTVTDNSDTIRVVGTLIGEDENYYHLNLEYARPVTQIEDTLVVETAGVYDIADGCFQVYGWVNDTTNVGLGIWSYTKSGTYTEDNLNHNYSFVYLNGETASIYDADITITEHADGSYTLTADLLCNNNVLYHVTMKVPVYCLVGTMNNWTPEKVYKFERNPENYEEYMLNVSLVEGNEFKVVLSYNGEILHWYPEGTNNNYLVAANYTGEKTIYFRPAGNTEWESFHQGGFFYMEPSSGTAIINAAVEQNAVKILRNGQFFIIKNGVHYNVTGAVVK